MGISKQPPRLWGHVLFNIGKFPSRSALLPLVSGKFFGFVDENERLERRTRPIDGLRKLLSNICAILRHHWLSEGMPSDVDTIFCEPQ